MSEGKGRVKRKSVVAVFSHRLLLAEAMSIWLDGDPAVSAVRQVRVGRDLLALARRGVIDMAFLDPGNPSERVFDLAARLRRLKRRLGILFLAGAAPIGWICRALKVDADGFLGKCADVEAVRSAVRAVRGGQKYFTPCAARVMSQIAARSPEIPSLTAREIEVMQLLAEGNSSKEIARRLGLSSKTVESVRAALLEKTRTRSSTRLVRDACDQRYVDPEPLGEPRYGG
jgi:DNA-binding NarL/FixJ family response regulator